jgi:putative ABC transport system permease protein
VSFDNGQTWVTIVGIVGDTRAFGLDRDAVAQLYRPLRQTGGLAGRLLVRTSGEPAVAAALIRDAVHGVDPDLPIENVRTFDEIRSTYLAAPRLTAMLLTVFAGLALLVTLAGITGVIAMSVTQRTQEFGVRMALGADRRRILRLVMSQGMVLALAGVAAGVAISLALSRLIASLLFGVAPTDPLTYAGVMALLGAVALAACALPAARAARVDPLVVLRSE